LLLLAGSLAGGLIKTVLAYYVRARCGCRGGDIL